MVLVLGTLVEYPPNNPFLLVAFILYTSWSLFLLFVRAFADIVFIALPLAKAFTYS